MDLSSILGDGVLGWMLYIKESLEKEIKIEENVLNVLYLKFNSTYKPTDPRGPW